MFAALDTFLPFLTDGPLGPKSLLAAVALGIAGLAVSKWGPRRLAVVLYAAVVGLVVLSVLRVPPKPLDAQPFPDAQETADSARQLASGNGYVTFVHNGEQKPPRYPPGFPLALAPFAAFGDYPANVQRGASCFAAVYVVAAAGAAWSLRGASAAAVAAVLVGVSPFAKVGASLVMSDAFAAGLTLLFVPLLRKPTPTTVALAGGLAGALVATRLTMVVNVAALLAVLSWRQRVRMLVYAAPFLAAFALFNWLTFGSPLRTGYDYWLPGAKNFDPAFAVTAPMFGDGPWVVGDVLKGALVPWEGTSPLGGPEAGMSNLTFYPAHVVGVFWVFVPALVPVVGLVYGWRNRRNPAVRFGLCAAAVSLLLFTFYFYQGSRFMAGPVTLLGVFASAQLTEWVEKISRVRSDPRLSLPLGA